MLGGYPRCSTVGGATVVIFNLPLIPNLGLRGPTLAAIYLGKITQWNDPTIVAQNPQIKLPDEEITIVHRSEDSGTTYIFTAFLASVSPEWKPKLGLRFRQLAKRCRINPGQDLIPATGG
jgi:phosphate transport system substrate-binding protein